MDEPSSIGLGPISKRRAQGTYPRIQEEWGQRKRELKKIESGGNYVRTIHARQSLSSRCGGHCSSPSPSRARHRSNRSVGSNSGGHTPRQGHSPLLLPSPTPSASRMRPLPPAPLRPAPPAVHPFAIPATWRRQQRARNNNSVQSSSSGSGMACISDVQQQRAAAWQRQRRKRL